MNRFLRNISFYLLIAILAVTVVSYFYQDQERPDELTWNEFITLVDSNQIQRVDIIGENQIVGQRRNGQEFVTYIPPGETGLSSRLLERGITVNPQPAPQPPWWITLLPNLLLMVAFIGVWFFILNQMQGSSNRAMSFGKSRAKLHTEEKSKVRFDDVAGLDEAKQELTEIVEFLKHPKRFVELGAKIPKGVLLAGPPGTGKTLLGRAVAGEAGVPFFSISGSDFVEMFVGVGASRVRDLFETAKRNAPCIVFIDELDAVGRQRGAGLGGGHDEREQTLNQLLVEMDGFEPNSGIIVMAATNRPDVLDPALLRPGRFDRKIVVDRADAEGREEILRIHSRNKPLDDDVKLDVLAKRTPGFSGADLENLMNEAAILAARKGKKAIMMEECEEAIDRVLMGPERRRRRMSEQDKEVFAFHEAGHAVVAHFLPNADPVYKVTIVGRGLAGGYTMTLPEVERAVQTREELVEILAFALGGRTAEEIKYNRDKVTTGAQSDLERVTKLARKMVTEWGMSEKLGPLTFGRQHEEQIFLGRDISRERNYSEEVAAQIDEEVREMVEDAHVRAREILEERWGLVEATVTALIERETLDQAAFEAIMEGREDPSASAETEDTPAEQEGDAEEARRQQRSEAHGRGVDGPLKKGKSPKPAIGLE